MTIGSSPIGSTPIAAGPSSTVNNYSVTAAAGSYVLTGRAAGLRKTERLVAATGSYSLSGQAALLERGLKVAAAVGAYTLTGQAANFLRGKSVAGAAGSYVLTGQAAGLRKTERLVAAKGTYTLTGRAALLERSLKVIAAKGTYTLTGRAASFGVALAYFLTAEVGSYLVTGTDVTLARTLEPMKRYISASARRELERQETAESFLCFVTITHPSIDEPIRVVADPKDFMLGGERYTGFLFDYQLLTDTDRYPEARLTLQNVDRKIGDAVRDLINPPRVKIEVYAMSDFDTTVVPRTPIGTPVAEYTADKLFLTDIAVDAMQIDGKITSWNYSQEVWPGVRATQNRFPGLFA